MTQKCGNCPECAVLFGTDGYFGTVPDRNSETCKKCMEENEMTLYIWECKFCGTRYIEGFSRVSNLHIGMEIMIPCPHGCKARPGITNESVMILKEIKRRKGE